MAIEKSILVFGGLLGVVVLLPAQHSGHDYSAPPAKPAPAAHSEMQGMDHGDATMSDPAGHHADNQNQHEHHHEMGAHMRMSKLRNPQPGDQERAEKISGIARQSLAKYANFRAAEEDGFKIFLPQVKQKMYHFTNWKYAVEAEFRFNPEHPTSLLYEKKGENDFKLIGAMYTAPARYSEDELDKRVPLSFAQWHQHVNMCQPPASLRAGQWGQAPRFGLAGSISTKEQCDAAGGTFKSHVFGWMVHVYPQEKTMSAIWSVDRQMDKSSASSMMK